MPAAEAVVLLGPEGPVTAVVEQQDNASLVLMPTDEGARGMGYMLQVERRTEDGPIEITLFGKYTDDWVKTAEGWRISERRFVADTWRGAATN